MSGRVEEDPIGSAWLDLSQGGAPRAYGGFALVEIGHHQVEMHLLGHHLAGPLRRPVVGDLLGREAIAAVFGADLDPAVAAGSWSAVAGSVGRELGRFLGAWSEEPP